MDEPVTLPSVWLICCTWFWRYRACSWYMKEAWGRKQKKCHSGTRYANLSLRLGKKINNNNDRKIYRHQTHRQSRHEDLYIQLGKTTRNTKCIRLLTLKLENTNRLIKYQVMTQDAQSQIITCTGNPSIEWAWASKLLSKGQKNIRTSLTIIRRATVELWRCLTTDDCRPDSWMSVEQAVFSEVIDKNCIFQEAAQ